MTEKTENKQQDHLFKKGESGNPSGRPKGSRNRTTLAAYELLNGESEALTRAAIEKAKEGDLQALKLCLDRIAPPLKNAPMAPVTLPTLKTMSDVPEFFDSLNQLLANGEISTHELASITGMVSAFSRTIDLAELEQRIIRLEGSDK